MICWLKYFYRYSANALNLALGYKQLINHVSADFELLGHK